jgi:hypothetical protein
MIIFIYCGHKLSRKEYFALFVTKLSFVKKNRNRNKKKAKKLENNCLKKFINKVAKKLKKSLV